MHLSSSSSTSPHTLPISLLSLQDSSASDPALSSSFHSSPQTGCSRLLPEECLQEIFVYLARDLSALYSLLLVSKTFFRIAMPLLYASPFDLLESNQAWSSQERTKRHASLLYLLLNCCSTGPNDRELLPNEPPVSHHPFWVDLPPVCTAFEAAHESLKRPLVDYLSAYHHHFLCMNLSSTFRILFPNIQRYSPPSLVPPSLLSTNVKHEEYRQQRQQTLTNTTITMFTRNEIERKLLLHRPECIRTISLPIQRLVAFQSIGSKLSGLVRFELYGISWHFNLDPAIEFLQEHSRLFGTIRELKMAGPNDVRVMQKPTLHKIIKLIKHPKVIDLSRYKEATRDLNTFEFQDISSLEQLLFDLDFVPAPQSPAPAHQNTDATQTQTLSFVGTTAAPPRISDAGLVTQNDRALDLIRRCANLRTLHIGVQNSTAFSWAVDRYNADPSSLQSIKVLHLSSHRPTTAKQLVQDCAYAFRDSLEDLKGVALKLSAVVPSPSETWFGWSWTLGRLTTLSLKGELAVWFDMESLAYCPKLTELNLTLHPYSPPRVDHLEKVVMAPHLKVLSLVGRWILTDRVMDKLGGGLEQLQRLVVDKCDSDALTVDGFIRGLDKMRALRVVEIELGERTEEVIRECRATQTGLGIHVRLNDLLSG